MKNPERYRIDFPLFGPQFILARRGELGLKCVCSEVLRFCFVSVRFSPASKRRFFPCAKAPFGLGARLSSRFPPRRQQFIDTAVGMRRQTREHIGQIRQRLDAIHLGRLNQTHDVGGARTRGQAATEEPILALMRRFT